MAARKISTMSNKGFSADPSGRGPGSRFDVRNVENSNNNDSDDTDWSARNQYTYVYDPRDPKSLGQLTREALPKADNYSNLGEIFRPTLDDLHNQTYLDKPSAADDSPGSAAPLKGKVVKFGWLEGVLMRCLLNIWGVMLFLRMSWCIGQAGLLEGVLLMSLANLVTFITAFSMSAVSTNGQISGGGIYYMISRSLGPEFGAAIGLMFTIANSIAVSLHTIGFCESVNDLLAQYEVGPILDGDSNAIRVVGASVLVCILILAFIGMDWVTRAQMFFLVVLVAAQVDFIVGSIMGPDDNEERAKGFIGYNSKTFTTNFWSDYGTPYGGGDTQQTFFSVFGVFFPSVTGIVAGANLSGDLKDPAGAIPKGTLLAITITYVSYIVYATMMSGCALREATGNVTQYELSVNEAFMAQNPGFLPYDYCEKGVQECDYGLLNSSQVMELVSAWGPLIYMGCFAATLSSAIASLVGAPRVLQALAKDRLYPLLHFFAAGYGANNDPVRGYILVFGISLGCILIAKLNAIAPIQSNFFLMAYCLINFSCFHASITKSPGWRPAFKYYNAYVSLLGSILCVVVMFLLSWYMALATVGCVAFLYLYMFYMKPEVNWGSSTQAQSYNSALRSVQNLTNVEEHVKNYRPQVLVFTGEPGRRVALVDFASLLVKNISLMVCGHVIREECGQNLRNNLNSQAYKWLKENKKKGFYSLTQNESFERGCKSIMEISGLGKLRPNMVLMGYKGNWGTEQGRQKLTEYFGAINEALGMHMAVGILRIEGGFDSHPTEEIDENPNKNFLDVMNELDSKLNESTSEENSPVSLRKRSRNGTTINIENDAEPSSQVNQSDALPPVPPEVTSLFRVKQKKGSIDVWWLYDDGGLTLLIPYILSTRAKFSGCKLRVFTLASSKNGDLDNERITMAALLAKFRIQFSEVVIVDDIQKKALDGTKKAFNALVEPFLSSHSNVGSSITQVDLIANKERTNRYLRLSEELQAHSQNATFVVLTLPIPRKGTVPAPLYMAWLEIMTRGMPPILLTRGNQTSVLTFYS